MPEWHYWQAMGGAMAGLLVFLLLLALALTFVWMLDNDLHREDRERGHEPLFDDDGRLR